MAAPDSPAASRECVVVAWAARRVAADAIPELRRRPGPLPADPLPLSFLKHADEQTVVGLAAVSDALAGGRAGHDFHDWGVLAAPRYLGRWAMAATMGRYQEEGPWGVSPHMIPHRSLHAVSGTVSQGLKLHGPNFGTGGGHGSEPEAFLTALALLHGKRLPGVWVVLTRVEPSLPMEDLIRPAAGCFIEGLALALRLAPLPGVPAPTLRLTLRPGVDSPADGLTLPALREGLTRVGAGEAPGLVLGGAGLQIELSNPAFGRATGPALVPGASVLRSA